MRVDRARMGVVIGQNGKKGFEGVGGEVVVVMIKLDMSYLAFFWEQMKGEKWRRRVGE